MKLSYIIKYLLSATIQEILINIYFLIDFILPDLTVFSPIRKIFASIFWYIGKKTRIRKGFRTTKLGKITIGKNCFINRNNFFDNNNLITIGDNCSIGFDNKFLTVNHIEKGKEREDNQGTVYSKPIKVGNNVWITTNCIILPGTEIGDNAIIGAGSVVNGNLESNWIYGGNPAKKIRKTEGILSKGL